MSEEGKYSFSILALVGIVAIVGLAVMFKGNSSQPVYVATPAYMGAHAGAAQGGPGASMAGNAYWSWFSNNCYKGCVSWGYNSTYYNHTNHTRRYCTRYGYICD